MVKSFEEYRRGHGERGVRKRVETREKGNVLIQGQPPIESRDDDNVARAMSENRCFLTVELNGQRYGALFDPGAMLSLAGARVLDRHQDSLRKFQSAIKAVNGKITPIVGIPNVSIEVDGVAKVLPLKVVRELENEIILGIDFCREFKVEVRFAKGQWRAGQGKWKSFANKTDAEALEIFAECAEILELEDDQRAIIERLVNDLLPPETETPGLTDLVEHHIDVQGAEPVRHNVRRMSPKLLEFAQGEVEKLRHAGIIERSASHWRSAPVVL